MLKPGNSKLTLWLDNPGQLFITIGALTLLSVALGIFFNQYLLMAAPLIVIISLQILVDFRKIFWLLLLLTPLSIEFYFSSSLATDLPTEPLMAILMLIFIFFSLTHPERLNRSFFRHPIIIIIGIHYVWLLLASVFSVDHLVSVKYMLAKSWYIVAFLLLSGLLIRKKEDFKRAFWLLFIPTFIIVILVLIKHAGYGFGFAEVNITVEPFFRNHVNYAVFLALMYPLIWLAATWYPAWSYQRMLLNLSKVIFIAAIYFSYTRSSWLSLIVGGIAFIAMKYNMMKKASLLGLLLLLSGVGFMLQNNRYLDYAPEFSKTIYHDEFGDHMAATTSLEDVSSAERIYRWVAAYYMFLDKPLTGFGPGNFYPHYQQYTVSSFYTYISRNEERSTVHNYYLQTLVEQGFPGLIIFFTLIFISLFSAQSAYTLCMDTKLQGIIIACTVSFVTVLSNIFFSDLIEADKIGTLFFFMLAMIVNADLQVRKGKLGN